MILDKNSSTQLKGIAIFLVIIGHLNGLRYLPLPKLFNPAGGWGVAIFLLLSGYGLAKAYLNSGLDGYFQKRVGKVVIPYFIVTLCWLVLDTLLLDKRYSFFTVISALAGLDLKATIDQTMWYIPFLLIWYIAFYFVFRLRVNSLVKVLLLFLFAAYLYREREIFSMGSGAGLYVLEFPIGVLMGLYPVKVSVRNLRLAGVVLIGCFIFLVNIDIQKFWLYAFVDLTFALGALAFVSSVKLESKVLEFIGAISYQIYLFEGAFLVKYKIISLIPNLLLGLGIYLVTVLSASILLRQMVDNITPNRPRGWLLGRSSNFRI